MSLLAVELNDSGICAARSAGEGLLVLDDGDRRSPGYACVAKRSLVTGTAAARRARLEPLGVNNRFWDRLDTEPADTRDPESPNRAEVACAHLEHALAGVLAPGERVVMAVPPVYDERQLGIIVAIARELKLPLDALVASAVAIEPDATSAGEILVVEPALHRTVLSVVEVGERVTLRQSRVCHDVGLDAFMRQWVKAIGAEFVRTTRFDPLHDAASEQRLYDALPAILEAVARDGEHRMSLEAGPLTHGITITETLLAQAGHSLIFALSSEVQSVAAAGRPASIVLSHAAARVPGLQRMVQQQAAVPVSRLIDGAAAIGLLRSWPDRFEPLEDEGVPYYTWREAGAVLAG